MEIKPVKLKRKPGYPTIKTFVDNPGLLSKNVPFAWIRNQYVATSLATFILCGCGNQSNTQKTKPDSVIVVKEKEKNKSDEIQNVKQDAVKIARIFSHGDGSGAIGCMVMSPPVFISEDEARKIIFTALKAENIEFSTKNTPVLKFTAPPIANSFEDENSKNIQQAKVVISIDGYNPQYNLAIEYVSYDDFNQFTSPSGGMSTLQGIHIKQAAELIRNELIAHGKMNAGIFYDPLTKNNFDPRPEMHLKKEKNPHSEARELLKAQVKDFIDWIKKEGIIKNQ
jgi:hypothetical protein